MQLVVDFGTLDDLQRSLRSVIDTIEGCLDNLDGQIQRLAQVWEGAAAEGFQRAVASWTAASRDLRDRVVFLHDLVGTAHANHRAAVSVNTRMWQV